VPSPHDDKFDDRCLNRREQPRSFSCKVESSAGKRKRQEWRGHRDDAHVHQHVRKERLACELRERS
jgi:hypothetical protein